VDYFETRRQLIDDRLEAIGESLQAPAPLIAPLRHSIASPGKRVRGLLTIAAAACQYVAIAIFVIRPA